MFSLATAFFEGVPLASTDISRCRCAGVGVSGVRGLLCSDIGCVITCLPFVHCSVGRLRVAGVVLADDAATSSSEDRFVCENDGDGLM